MMQSCNSHTLPPPSTSTINSRCRSDSCDSEWLPTIQRSRSVSEVKHERPPPSLHATTSTSQNVISTFTQTAANPRFRFHGNVEVGVDVALRELRDCYTAVILVGSRGYGIYHRCSTHIRMRYTITIIYSLLLLYAHSFIDNHRFITF